MEKQFSRGDEPTTKKNLVVLKTEQNVTSVCLWFYCAQNIEYRLIMMISYKSCNTWPFPFSAELRCFRQSFYVCPMANLISAIASAVIPSKEKEREREGKRWRQTYSTNYTVQASHFECWWAYETFGFIKLPVYQLITVFKRNSMSANSNNSIRRMSNWNSFFQCPIGWNN